MFFDPETSNEPIDIPNTFPVEGAAGHDTIGRLYDRDV